MNKHPLDLLDPVLYWLDHLIADYGIEIYLVIVWLSSL